MRVGDVRASPLEGGLADVDRRDVAGARSEVGGEPARRAAQVEHAVVPLASQRGQGHRALASLVPAVEVPRVSVAEQLVEGLSAL